MSGTQRFRCQNLYLCTSKASKLSTLTQGGGQDSKELRNSRVCETRAGNNPFWASVLRMPQVSCACVLDENRGHRCSVLFPMYTFRIKVKCAACSADRSSKALEPNALGDPWSRTAGSACEACRVQFWTSQLQGTRRSTYRLDAEALPSHKSESKDK